MAILVPLHAETALEYSIGVEGQTCRSAEGTMLVPHENTNIFKVQRQVSHLCIHHISFKHVVSETMDCKTKAFFNWALLYHFKGLFAPKALT